MSRSSASPRRRGRRSRPPRPPRFLLLGAGLLVVVAGVALLLWARTPRGGAALLASGAEQMYGPVQARIGEAVAEVFPQAWRSGTERRWPLPAAGADAAVACRALALPAGLGLGQAEAKLVAAARRAGGRRLWSGPLPGGAGEPVRRVDLGVPGLPTHTLILCSSPADIARLRWGAAGAGEVAPRGSRLGGSGPGPAADGPLLAIVIDDWGCCETAVTRELLGLEAPLTLAVIPGQPHSARFAAAATPLATEALRAAAAAAAVLARPRALARGEAAGRRGRLAAGCVVEVGFGPPPAAPPVPDRRREVILHLPMEADGRPEADLASGPDALRVGMAPVEIVRLLGEALASVPEARGVSNHMGSRATADGGAMEPLMAELARRRLYFLDSLTTPRSVAGTAARRQGVPYASNRLFLDEGQPDPAEIERRLERLVEAARARGAAIGIGHPRQATLEALRDALPRLRDEGLRLVTVSELLALHVPSDDDGEGSGADGR